MPVRLGVVEEARSANGSLPAAASGGGAAEERTKIVRSVRAGALAVSDAGHPSTGAASATRCPVNCVGLQHSERQRYSPPSETATIRRTERGLAARWSLGVEERPADETAFAVGAVRCR